MEPSAASAKTGGSGDAEGSPPKGRRGRRWRRVGYIAIGLAVFYTLFGFFGVPLIAKHLVVPKINEHLNGRLTLARTAFNPFTFNLRLENLEITDEEPRRVLAFDRFEGQFNLFDTLTHAGYHFDKAVVTAPFVDAVLRKNGDLNLIALIKPDTDPDRKPPEPLKKIPRVVVKEMGVIDANLALRDRMREEPFDLEVRDISFRLDGLDTRADHKNAHRFGGRTDSGEGFAWEGTFNTEPFASHGTFSITSFNIPRLMPYGGPFTYARIQRGTLSVDLEYELAPLAQPPVAGVTVKSVSLDGVAATLANEPLYELGHLRVAGVKVDAVARTVNVGGVTIESAVLNVQREKDGTLNLEHLPKKFPARAAPATIATATPPPPPPDPSTIPYPVERLVASIERLIAGAMGPWSLGVDKVELKGWKIAFEERSTPEPVGIIVSNLDLEAGPVRTSEGYNVPFKTSMRINESGSVAVAGAILAPLTPERKVAADVTVENLALTPLSPYVKIELPEGLPTLKLGGATLALSGHAEASETAPETRTASWTGKLGVSGFRLDDVKTNAPVAAFVALEVDGDASVQVAGVRPQSATWKGTTTLKGLTADAPLERPVKANVGSLSAAGTLNVTLPAEGAPTLAFDGRAGVGALKADIAGADPAHVTLGEAEATGKTGVSQGADGQTAIRFTGDARLASLDASAPTHMDANISLASATASKIDFTAPALTLKVDDVVVDTPVVKAVLALLPPPTAKEKETEAAPSDAPSGAPAPFLALGRMNAPPVYVGRFTLKNGSVEVSDPGAVPPAVVRVDSLGVEASRLSTDGRTDAQLAVTARVQDSGALNVSGKADPFRDSPYADVTVDLKGMALKPYDPFTARYLGYLVDKGHLSMTLPLKLQDGKLDGRLNVNLDRFYLGDSVPSPDAPDVPIKLGLGILRDLDEQINAKVGLTGDITDPQFSVASIVWQAFFNLIVKAATAPFQILGALFGGGDNDDLSQIAFAPGSDELSADALTNIEPLTRALKERPALSMTAIGKYNREADTPALRVSALRAQMLARARQADPLIETLTDEQYRAMVTAAYSEMSVAIAKTGRPSTRERKPGPAGPGVIRPVEKVRADEADAQGRPAEPFDRMEEAMLAAVTVGDDLLADLAARRARRVVEEFLKDGTITPERVKAEKTGDADAAGDAPKVEFKID